MTPFLVCLATMLCLIPASVRSDSNAGECQTRCDPYHDSGFLCALQNQCVPPLDDDEEYECYASCMSLYYECPSVCEDHYDNITTTCQSLCGSANASCEDNCFDSLLEHILHNPSKREVSMWQTVPGLGRQRKEARGDSTQRVAPRHDSKRSTSSEDVGDLFGIWRKKRDTKRSPDSSISMDMDNIFEDWGNERDTKRSPDSSISMDMDNIFEDWGNERNSRQSPGSTSSEDVGDVFGIWKRGQDWSWEESDSDGDVYGGWYDKRQAETEIQQQKQ